MPRQIFSRLTIAEKVSYQRLRQVPSALGCFIKVGPQRASGQRMVCMCPGCSVDIRRATVVLTDQDLREKV
jgi:hypothetical protein